MKSVWKQRIDPFTLWGNVKFCGTVVSSNHIIDTGEGLILIDSGLPETLYLFLESLWELGHKPADIKAIVHTHGHYDHAGATKSLLCLAPEAKTYIGAGDADIVRGKSNLSLADSLGAVFDGFFEPDVCLGDGDHIILGNTDILCLATPGHSDGTMTYFFDAVNGDGRKMRCGMHGGAGINSMMLEFYEQHGLDPRAREQFVPGLERVRGQRVDITLGSHTFCNATQLKGKRVMAGDPEAFVDETEWAKYCDRNIAAYNTMVGRGQ